MANRNQVWGRTRITANGGLIDTEGKSTFQPGGITREPVKGDFRSGLFTETDQDSKLECSVLLMPGVSVVALQAIDDATLTIEADTGQTYVVRHAYVSEAVEASEGKAKVVFIGPAAEEMSL